MLTLRKPVFSKNFSDSNRDTLHTKALRRKPPDPAFTKPPGTAGGLLHMLLANPWNI